ncbi:hypothetical protein ACM75L_33040, partial [Pseudomonas aeruginosa]
ALEGKTMKTVVFSDTLKKLSVGQKVYAQGGGHGVISEIRENCVGIPCALGHPVHADLDTHSTATWTLIPRPLGH